MLLSPEAPTFTPRKRLNESGPPQVGQVCWVPTSLPWGPLSSCCFLSFPQSPMTMTGCHWSGEGTLSTPSPGQTLGKRSPTTILGEVYRCDVVRRQLIQLFHLCLICAFVDVYVRSVGCACRIINQYNLD